MKNEILKQLLVAHVEGDETAFIAGSARGMSFADVGRTCDDAIRTMALAGREHLEPEDAVDAFARTQHREGKDRRNRG